MGGYRCIGVSVRVGISVYRCGGISVYRCIGVWGSRCIGVGGYRCIGVGGYRCIGVSVRVGISVYRYRCMGACRDIGVSVWGGYRCIGVSVQRGFGTRRAGTMCIYIYISEAAAFKNYPRLAGLINRPSRLQRVRWAGLPSRSQQAARPRLSKSCEI